MKKIFLILFLVGIAGTSLFAWEAKDLTKFPSCMDAKSWILNLGMGLSDLDKFGDGYIYIPPLRLSLDRNIAIGDNNLPFFAGGTFGYTGYGYKGHDHKKKFFYHDFSTGGRFGYHFNWGVKNLDTYAVTTAGYIFYGGDHKKDIGKFFWGVNAGVRYFVSKGFGFWAEAGFNTFSYLDVGFAFKF